MVWVAIGLWLSNVKCCLNRLSDCSGGSPNKPSPGTPTTSNPAPSETTSPTPTNPEIIVDPIPSMLLWIIVLVVVIVVIVIAVVVMLLQKRRKKVYFDTPWQRIDKNGCFNILLFVNSPQRINKTQSIIHFGLHNTKMM